MSSSVFSLISGDSSIIIPSCDGLEMLATAKTLFPFGIDRDLSLSDRNWYANVSGKSTGPTPVSIYKQVADSNFPAMFLSFGVPISNLLLTEDQIIKFRKLFENWLDDGTSGGSTFFLSGFPPDKVVVMEIKKEKSAKGCGHSVRNLPYNCGISWSLLRSHRLVIPSLVV